MGVDKFMLAMENVGLTLGGRENPVRILEGINLNFEAGKMYALTGPNGSGKSSVVKTVMGIYPPTEGKIEFQGEDIANLTVTERARMGIGYAFQQPARFKGLRVSDLLEVALKHGDLANCQCLRKIGLCPDSYLDRPLDSSLSGGEMKRIEIATLLAQNPRFRIFDEPEAGIDLWSFEQLINVVRESHSPEKVTVIISHQERILNMVDEIILIVDGHVELQGDSKTIWPRVRDFSKCACRESCVKEGEIYADCPR